MNRPTERIACLGWGSLIWQPGDLPVHEWNGDGPPLPVEFARQSRNGRLTLVLLDEGHRVPMLHCTLRVVDMDAAILALSAREGCPRRSIGCWTPAGTARRSKHDESIGQWAANRGFDGVVWTALRPKFDEVDGRVPTSEDAVSYLAALTGDSRQAAEEYIRKTPSQIRTPYRQIFESRLGWTPSEQ